MTMKAWSLLQVKDVNEVQRMITGMATTPTVDRVGDLVVPEGVILRGPINLHLYHKHELPVGSVEFGRPTKNGIPFVASIPDVQEEGTVRDRVNEALHSVKYRLLGAVSIGFRALEGGVELMKSGGLKFNKWEMIELSLVSVPANPDAVIQSFKSLDASQIRDCLGVENASSPERAAIVKSLLRGGVRLIQTKKESQAPLEGGAIRLNSPK